MANRPQDETALREYLLGILPEPMWDEIEQKLLTDEEFAGAVEIAEDELIDDFLDGGLTRTERTALESHFLRSPEHRHKLEFARLLHSQLRMPKKSAHLRLIPLVRPPAFYRALTAGCACLLVLTMGLAIYSAKLRQELSSETARNQKSESMLQASMDQIRTRIAELERKPEGNTEIATAYPVHQAPLRLDLLSTQTRDSGDARWINCSPETSSIEVRIALVNGALSSYDAALFGPGDWKLWSKAGISPVSVGPGKQLVFSIPNTLPCDQQYSLVVTGKGESVGANYTFSVVQGRQHPALQTPSH